MSDPTAAYYRITEDAYRALAPEGTDHMNLGLWPAGSLVEAQVAVIDETFAHHIAHGRDLGLQKNPTLIIEGGSGFGAARDVATRHFPASAYVGLNSSPTQIAFARARRRAASDTRYVEVLLESFRERRGDIFAGCDASATLFFAIEAVLHVANKATFFQSLGASGVGAVALADITLESPEALASNRLFHPALSNTRSSADYSDGLAMAGFKRQSVVDLSARVFKPWAAYLASLDEGAFPANKRVLRQFKDSYRALADLAERGLARYLLISAYR